MDSSPKLPPSHRDFLVYQRIVVDGASTRSAADELKISQSRVRQLVRRVTHWLGETLPEDSESSEAQQLRLARHIAADRLEHYYRQANRAWEQTAQPKFAGVCLRILAAQSKLSAIPGTLEALAMDAIVGPLPADTSSLYAPCDTTPPPPKSEVATVISDIPLSPPLRDCSAAPSPGATAAERSPSIPAVTPPAKEACDKTAPATRSARAAFLSPAHPSAPNGKEAPVTELKITPAILGLTTNQHSSRQDRRRLRRVALSK
jgi:hypothetical protein